MDYYRFFCQAQAHCIVLEKGVERRVDRDYFKFGYDDSILHHDKDVFVLEIVFELESKDKNLIKNQISENPYDGQARGR